ncbi:hypothetical protein V2J09_005349 [Rumex salicifolius]
MGEVDSEKKQVDGSLHGLFSVSSPRVLWKSRRRRASTKRNPEDVAKVTDEPSLETPEKLERSSIEEQIPMDSTPLASVLSEKRKALFEPLDPATSKRTSAETLLPPPDFDSAIYPKGWLVGKKRKLVNVDVVESMRRIAVQEMNRKDREINGLNEQLEEDSRCLEHLQIQLLEEKRKRSEVERENNMLQEQLNMLMNVLQENEAMDEEEDIDGIDGQEP